MSGDEVKEYTPTMGDGAKSTFGRPPKYSEELLEQAHDYLMGEWKSIGDYLPSLEGLASYIGVCVKTVHNWKNDVEKKQFLHICNGVMTLQARYLINNGVMGVYAQPVTKMMLSKHGYSDKVDTNHTNDGKPFDNNPVTIDTSKLSTDQLRALREALTTDGTETG